MTARKVELIIYRPIRSSYDGTVDAIESAWSRAGNRPFDGTRPIFFGFRWEAKDEARNLLSVWNNIVRRLNQRRFLTPDGARFWPGEMSLTPVSRNFYRAWLTFERKGVDHGN
jgi:hypothetical protein